MEERALQPIISLASSEWANVAIQRRVAWALSGVGLAMSGMTDAQYARVDSIDVRIVASSLPSVFVLCLLHSQLLPWIF